MSDSPLKPRGDAPKWSVGDLPLTVKEAKVLAAEVHYAATDLAYSMQIAALDVAAAARNQAINELQRLKNER